MKEQNQEQIDDCSALIDYLAILKERLFVEVLLPNQKISLLDDLKKMYAILKLSASQCGIPLTPITLDDRTTALAKLAKEGKLKWLKMGPASLKDKPGFVISPHKEEHLHLYKDRPNTKEISLDEVRRMKDLCTNPEPINKLLSMIDSL